MESDGKICDDRYDPAQLSINQALKLDGAGDQFTMGAAIEPRR